MAKILAFSGSSREDSYNQKLVNVAAKGAQEAGAEVTVINLGDYPMPLFNQDDEAEKGVDAQAKAFKDLLLQHDGLLIASPEYNSAFSPLLKNAIDWASRSTEENEPPLSAYKGKYAVIMSASPGGLGGMRGLVFLRMLLGNIGVVVLPQQQAVAAAFKAFNDEGGMVDPEQESKVKELGAVLAKELMSK
ncbi:MULTISPECIES: NAD(P)H-dependent oxidoreductase [unclassified Neptuniibacter]|uniref:NADPH-dependent FMN reductase n=1 Tax=unclassified Neptuniibacter TaxID=2630693 RepID=UPI000C502D4B|nr:MULTISPECIES: NAD(P)H-dependent oxidoreductase [unclassified Neptuniibacter]MAY43110.1 FMN reductase [Oceanospirillaceae bacterium]|tara:strand:- start:8157 stop:8726 length:570 start_codon:yes stop_codon:yes gene_type:complete